MFDNLRIPDPSFILNPVQSLPGAAVEGFGKGMAMNDLFKKYQMNAIQLDQAQRTQAATAAQDQLSKTAPPTPQGQMQVAAGLAQQGFGQEAAQQQKWAEEWAQHNQEFSAKSQELLKDRMSSSARFLKKLPPEQLPAAWAKFKADLTKDGYDTTDVPEQPTPEALDVMEKANVPQKEIDQVKLENDKLAEEKRWHDMQKEMAKDKAANGGGGLTTAWTDNGLVVVDKKTHTYVPTAPAGGPGGPAQPVPRQLPFQVNEAINKNMMALAKIDAAEKAIDAYKNATGLLKGMAQTTDAGAALLNKADPKGVEARAAISDIGSLLLHDRSGAAVTVSEAPRLKPFVPLGTDSYKTVKAKLRRLREFAQTETGMLKSEYPSAGPDGGAGGGASGTWSPGPSSQPPAGQIWSRVPKKQ